MPQSSTTDHTLPLIKLAVVIRMGKNRKLATLLLQFDFSKAFDNVSPYKLLRKLQASKTSLTWFWSYLCDRLVCVTSKTSTSSYRTINLRVPFNVYTCFCKLYLSFLVIFYADL